MAYDLENEATDRREILKKIQDVQDQLYDVETIPTENVTDSGQSFIGKIRPGDSVGGGAGDNLGDHVATQSLLMQDNAIFFDIAQAQSIIGLNLSNVYTVPVSGTHDFYVNDIVTPKFGITENSIESNVELNMNLNDISGVVNIDFDDPLSTISGLQKIDFFQAGQSIQDKADADGGILYDVNNIQSHMFRSNGIEIARFSEATPNNYFLDMLTHKIINVADPTNPQDVVTLAYGDANYGGVTKLSELEIDADKSWLGFNITDFGSIGSNAAITPGSGFIRMGTSDEISWKNPSGTDDIIIKSGTDTLGNDAVIFFIEGGNQMTMSDFNLDLLQNNIKGVGNITPASPGNDVGDGATPFGRMFADFFIPDGATPIAQRYALAKTGNILYINFEDNHTDAGFGIFEEGVRHFLFSRTGTTPFVNEFAIAGTGALAGETYKIQMGNSGNDNSASISLVEGDANNLIINRAGAVPVTASIELRSGGLTTFLANTTESKFFSDVNVNAQDLTNVVDIKSNGNGGATTGTIGELITADGGFDYFLRNRITWESNQDTFIQMDVNNLALVSDGGINLVSVDGMNIIIDTSTGLSVTVDGAVRTIIQDNGLVLSSGVSLLVQSNYANFTEITTPLDPPSNEGRFYAKDVGGITTPMWLDSTGTETSLLGGTGGGTSFIGFTADANLDMGAFDITNVDDITMNGVGSHILNINTIEMVGAGSSEIFNINEIDFEELNHNIQSSPGILSIMVGSGDVISFSSSGVVVSISATAMTFADGFLVIFNPSTTNAGINIGSISGDPSTTNNADLWYDTATNKLRAKENGVNVDVIGGGGSGTSFIGFTADANLDMGGKSILLDVAQTSIISGFQTDQIDFLTASSLRMQITNSAISMLEELSMFNLNKITNVLDPVNPQDVVTKAYGDANYGGGGNSEGNQDFYPWLEHETDQFDFEVYMSNCKIGDTGAAGSLGVDIIHYVPFYLSQRARLVRMGVELTTNEGVFTLGLGIYANRTDGQNYPGTKIQSVTQFHSGIGAKTISIPVNLEPGLYWLAIVSSTGLDIKHYTTGDANSVGYQLDGSDQFQPIIGFVQNSSSLPTTPQDNMNDVGTNASSIFAKFEPNTS